MIFHWIEQWQQLINKTGCEVITDYFGEYESGLMVDDLDIYEILVSF